MEPATINSVGGVSSSGSSDDQADAAAPNKQTDQDAEKPQQQAGFFGRMKAAIKAQTRAGRIEAQNAEIAAERERQREMDPTPFPFRAYDYGELLDPKNVHLLKERGGISGVLRALGVDPHHGLDLSEGIKEAEASSSAENKERDLEATAAADSENITNHKDFIRPTKEDRERVYGPNRLPDKKSKSLLLLMWLTLQDKILVSRERAKYSFSMAKRHPACRSCCRSPQSSLSPSVSTPTLDATRQNPASTLPPARPNVPHPKSSGSKAWRSSSPSPLSTSSDPSMITRRNASSKR